MATELDDFFAQLDEISTDSASVDHFELKAQKNENKRLRTLLITTKDSTKEILALYRKEREITISLQKRLDNTLEEFNLLQRQHDEFERKQVNDLFNQTQIHNELMEKKAQEHEDYVELSKEFFEVLSETTCFYNYEIKKHQNRIISKTERFLFEAFGEKFKKPKICRSRRGDREDEEKSQVSRSSSRSSKRVAKQKESNETKRRKTDFWDMQSISQASSPTATTHIDDETSDLSSEICEVESSFSFNTFSIGNETSFSFLQSQKSSPIRETHRCKCHLFAESDTMLVSVGTNTEEAEEPLLSLPPLEDVDDSPNVIIKSVESKFDHKVDKVDKLTTTFPLFSVLRYLPEEPDVLDNPTQEETSVLEETNYGELLHNFAFSQSSNTSHFTLASTPEKIMKYSSIATNTDAELTSAVTSKTTVEQGTSPEQVQTCNKSTATVRSTTTRGTSTLAVSTKSCGIQFPEISFEKIFSETIFDLPDLVSPIVDLDDLESLKSVEKEMATTGTITELSNVTREIDYMSNAVVKVKSEGSSGAHESFMSSEKDVDEESFIILGQTLFNLFLKRMKKNNESLSEDEILRHKIWKHLKRQLLDRFSEIPMDEMLNGSFSDCEHQENAPVGAFSKRDKEFDYEPICEDSDVGEHQSDDFEGTDDCYMHQPSRRDQIEINRHDQLIDIVPEECQQTAPVNSNACEVDESKKEDVAEVIKPQIHDCIDEPKVHHSEYLQPHEDAQLKHVQPEPLHDIVPAENISLPQCQASTSDHQSSEVSEESVTDHQSRITETQTLDYNMFEEAIESFKTICSSPPPTLVEPIDDLSDVIWSSLFGKNADIETDDSPAEPSDVLEGFDVEYEPIEIPNEVDDEVMEILQSGKKFAENETPKSPLHFTRASRRRAPQPLVIPIETAKTIKTVANLDSVLEFRPEIRKNLVQWSQRHTIHCKPIEKELCKIRKSIKTYLDGEWTDENLDLCLKAMSDKKHVAVVEAIHETVEDYKDHTDVNTEFTPPAPPLPRYQQKLILLIHKLSDSVPNLHHKLIEDLEEKLFRLENSALALEDLRNISYYYTSLVDLFFDGDTTMVFYFLVKCIYFFGYKAIPMAFVLLKAFPLSLPKKSLLLKKYSKDIDWENMSGIELSKVHLDLNWMDSLDLTVMYLLTCIQQYRRKAHESNIIKDHELFNYLPKFYGFPLSFITAPKLLELLMKRFEEGKLENLSLSFILLAKRTNPEFTVRTMLRGSLIPSLHKVVDGLTQSTETRLEQCSILVESISTIMKTLAEEKEKVATEIFPLLVSILGRVESRKLQEDCIKAILRLQRFISNHKDVFTIIQHHHDNSRWPMSESLRCAVQTFIHRKNQNFFAN